MVLQSTEKMELLVTQLHVSFMATKFHTAMYTYSNIVIVL